MTVRVDEIRLTHVRLPLHEPFVISSGAVAEKDAVLIELLGDGLTGLGEASPMAGTFYSRHTPEACWDDLTQCLLPALQRTARTTPREFLEATASIKDPYARCGIETAMCDLLAKAQRTPLYRFLGGRGDAVVESGLAVGIYDRTDTLVRRIRGHLERDGYRRVKIKVQPGWDVEPLAAVRDAFPNVPLMVDANASYRRANIEQLAAWDRFGLMMIEQPLPADDLEGHAALARSCRTPICLDESAADSATVRAAIACGAAQIINIKLQRVAGFTAAVEILRDTAAAGVGCWIGTMPELAVGGWAAVHLATLANVCYPTDVEASDRWFPSDVTTPPIRCTDGVIHVPHGPGLGVTLDAEVVRRHTQRTHKAGLSLQLGSPPGGTPTSD